MQEAQLTEDLHVLPDVLQTFKKNIPEQRLHYKSISKHHILLALQGRKICSNATLCKRWYTRLPN